MIGKLETSLGRETAYRVKHEFDACSVTETIKHALLRTSVEFQVDGIFMARPTLPCNGCKEFKQRWWRRRQG